MTRHSTNPEFTNGNIATRANIEEVCRMRDKALTKIKEAAASRDISQADLVIVPTKPTALDAAL